MSCKCPMVKQLSILSGLKENSRNLYSVAKQTLTLAFFEPKPLFPDTDKASAARLLEKSLPLLTEAFATLNISLVIDNREYAQCLRSGLQYLIDEFVNTEVHTKLQPILTSEPVKSVEEFIVNTKDLEPDYPDYRFTIDEEIRKTIPSAHYWCF